MQSTLRQMVEMDRHAREITESAQKQLLEVQETTEERCEALRKEYLEKARHRIAENEPAERAAAEKAWEKRLLSLRALEEKMDHALAESGDRWALELCRRAIGS